MCKVLHPSVSNQGSHAAALKSEAEYIMADIPQNAQVSGELLQAMFASRMTDMIVLDLVVAVAILLAHRWFIHSERKKDAMLDLLSGRTRS